MLNLCKSGTPKISLDKGVPMFSSDHLGLTPYICQVPVIKFGGTKANSPMMYFRAKPLLEDLAGWDTL